MAMSCIKGCRECDGCGRCFADAEIVGKCVECCEDICAGEDYYNIEGELVCDNCLHDWARKYRVRT